MSYTNDLVPVDQAEAIALAEPQVGCQVIHRFGPGLYIRECLIPRNVFVIGHRHIFPHLNVVLSGSVSMRENDGDIHVVRAPYFYTSPPGRKMGLALDDLVWWNVYPTQESDVEKLELALLDKSPAFLDAAMAVKTQQTMDREADRQDFFAALVELGITVQDARRLSEIEHDQMPMPPGWNLIVRESPIEGRGVFVQIAAQAGEVLGPARIGLNRTPAGRFANHSRNPSAEFFEDRGTVYVKALRTIAAYCNELVPGDEITIDYRQAARLAWRLNQ